MLPSRPIRLKQPAMRDSRPTSAVLLLGVLAAFVCGGISHAAPVVPGFERFGRPAVGAANPAASAEAGLLLLGEFGCVNCHAPQPAAARHLSVKTGPSLVGVGSRINPAWVIDYLKQPHTSHPSTTMPDVLGHLPDREQAATALAHYLAARAPFDDGAFPGASEANAGVGAALYERVGCAVCHGSRLPNAVRLPDQVPLVKLDRKWSPAALDQFLHNPFAIRSSGRMPALPLGEQDRRHLVASLLGPLPESRDDYRDVVAFNGRAWSAAVQRLPALESLGPPAKSGLVKGFDIFALAGHRDGVVVQLDGFLHAPRDGRYHFVVSSDDGSRITVGDSVVVEHDGIHGASERGGGIDLSAGVHPIRIDYFEWLGQEQLAVDVVVPQGPRLSLLAWVTPKPDGAPAVRPADAKPLGQDFPIDPSLVERGRDIFTAVGCGNCHEMQDDDGGRTASRMVAKSLAELHAVDRGCLSSDTGAAGPRYGIDQDQRTAIAAALKWLGSAEASQPPTRTLAIDRAFTALNCYACHERDGKGGVVPAVAQLDDDGEPVRKEAARDAVFTSAHAELGDEGRLPPSLTAVGDKLRPEFLRDVLHHGGRDRGAYMQTLMPKWHPPVVEPLATLLADDVRTTTPTPPLAGHSAETIVEQGRHLVGSKALGCIKCHAFAGEKGQSLGVIDMVRMPHRLRHDWFLAYVADPQRFRPGTRMPASWPEGKTFFPDILDGTAPGQIEAVWRYLAGPAPKAPIGTGANPIELVPAGKPIIYRNFIAGAGLRAIAVGYPEKVSLAWDAELMRLALVWRGAFLDAGRHWSGRGGGLQPPLGDGVFSADKAAAVAVLAEPSGPWPVHPRISGGTFGGYTLDASGRPTFLWSIGGMQVRETIEPMTDGSAIWLRRTIRLQGRPKGGTAFFRPIMAAKVDETADGWFRIDDRWRVRVSGDGLGDSLDVSTAVAHERRYPIIWTNADSAEWTEELGW